MAGPEFRSTAKLMAALPKGLFELLLVEGLKSKGLAQVALFAITERDDPLSLCDVERSLLRRSGAGAVHEDTSHRRAMV
jgi:hypothetical protein